MCVCVCLRACVHFEVRGFGELALFFHHVSPGEELQVLRLDNKYFYPLSHLTSPSSFSIRQIHKKQKGITYTYMDVHPSIYCGMLGLQVCTTTSSFFMRVPEVELRHQACAARAFAHLAISVALF